VRRLCIGLILLAAAACFPGHAAALLSSGPTSGPAPLSDSARRHAAELSRHASDLIDRHQFSEAEHVLRQALELVPDNLTCLYNLACVYAALHEPDKAMNQLEAATAAGFTDFHRIETDPFLESLHDLPRFKELLGREQEIEHAAGERILQKLRDQFGTRYRYAIDAPHKREFAVHASENALEELERMLNVEAESEAEQVFQHPPHDFIRIIIAAPADFAKIEHRAGVGGRYDDSTRTVLTKRIGPELRHEFTHALHAADQHATGQQHPVWLSEGLATLYEYPRENGEGDDRRMLPADTWRLSHVQSAARHHSLIPLEKLLTLDRAAFTARPDLAYGESGSLLLYLYERGLLKSFYENYTAGYAKDPTGRAALEKTTGTSLDALQDAWIEWLLPRKVPPRNVVEPLE